MSYNNDEIYQNNLPVGSNSLAELFGDVNAAPRELFRGINNVVMLFYIPPRDPQRKKYKDLITQHGGIITESEPRDNNNIILISSQPISYKTTYKPEFIDDCIASGTLVDLDNYKVLPLNYLENKPKTHNRFDSAKDQYILEQVRRNPRKRNSHAFFDNLAEHEVLRAHSGNSIRSRYRVHLRDKLDYVYKTNSNDELVTDENGNLIRVSVEDFPFTLKNRFTAEDDYLLCKEILRFNVERNEDPNFDPYGQLSVPISFFGDFVRNKTAKSHTINSWRDRYRKYVFKHGVKRYIDYYESCLKDNVTPKAITKPNDISSEFRNLIGSSYNPEVRRTASHESGDSALDEEIGEVKSSNIDHALIDQDERRRLIREQKQLQIQSSQVDENEAAILAQSTQSPQTSLLQPEANSSEIAQVRIANGPVTSIETSETIEIAQTAQTYQPQISEDASKNNDTIAENESSSKEPQEDLQSEQFFDTNEGIPDSQEADENEVMIRYAPESVELHDILNTNLMRYADPNELVVQLFHDMNSGDSVPNFFIKFKSLGFNDVFTAHAIMCASGDVAKIKTFIEVFLKRLYERNEAQELLPDKVYDLLRVNNVNGIWNEKHDSLLGTKLERKLLKIHSETEIELRKSFLQEAV